MRKKLLLLAYNFPPCNSVASPRAQSWAENLPLHGFGVTVITRHWTGKENMPATDFIKEDLRPRVDEDLGSYKVIRLPYRQSKLYQFLQKGWVQQLKPLRSLVYISANYFGRLNIELDFDAVVWREMRDEIKAAKYDIIVSTAMPFNMTRLAYRLSKYCKVPFAADFRDLWHNQLADPSFKPEKLSEKIFIYTHQSNILRWLRSAVLISTVSEPLANVIRTYIPKVPVVVITNGFEEKLFAHCMIDPELRKFFTITVTGTLSPQQRLDIMIDGLKRFMDSLPATAPVRLQLIGITATPGVAEKFSAALPAQFLWISDRLPRAEAIQRAYNSDVLLYAGWPGYKGIYSVKVFEYLGLRRNILLAPGDHQEMDELVKRANAGKVAYEAGEIADFLIQWYAEWQQKGELSYFGNEAVIKEYTRESQAAKFAVSLQQVLK